MSQITRCPSCSTTFKVVADQLRISEGWVRCGQCKEVFDASAHLLAAAPAALLPDVSLTDVRPPPVPVARPPDAGRAWGQPPASAPVSTPREARISPATAAAPPLSPPAAPPVHTTMDRDGVDEPAEDTAVPEPASEAAPVAPTLEVPLPAVPAFLSAESGEGSTAPLSLEGATPFSWRARPPAASPAAQGPGGPAGGDAVVDSGPGVEPPDIPATPAAASKSQEPRQTLLTPLPPIPGGYELPAAEPVEAEASDAPASSDAFVELTPMGYPALELPPKAAPPVSPPPPSAPPDAAMAPGVVAQDMAVPLPSVDFAPLAASLEPEPEALSLVEDRSPAAVLQAVSRKPSLPPAEHAGADDDEDDTAEADPEVSFVRAARRQAFWRKPQVRVALVAMILLAMAGFALQVAVQERDRLAAAEPRLRPMLLTLCASLQCEIAPPRQIADIVIDSSSFNKARGDSYHLALTMKSKASIPLAMPAVELTLTDAQDQPMLRRVLLPTDMGAPMELPAGGEWSASLSVIVTTGGARVAGYRLLAFYP